MAPTTAAHTDRRQAIAQRNVEAILDAVEALLARGSQASIAAVAAEAGVSRVTVYAHFPTREALLEAVVERAVRRTAGALDAARPDEGPPGAALERLVAAGWRELDRNGAIADGAARQLSPAAMARAHASARQRIGELVRRGRAGGEFRSDVPADWLVTACLALMHACGDEVRAGRLDAELAPGILAASLRALFVGRGGG